MYQNNGNNNNNNNKDSFGRLSDGVHVYPQSNPLGSSPTGGPLTNSPLLSKNININYRPRAQHHNEPHNASYSPQFSKAARHSSSSSSSPSNNSSNNMALKFLVIPVFGLVVVILGYALIFPSLPHSTASHNLLYPLVTKLTTRPLYVMPLFDGVFLHSSPKEEARTFVNNLRDLSTEMTRHSPIKLTLVGPFVSTTSSLFDEDSDKPRDIDYMKAHISDWLREYSPDVVLLSTGAVDLSLLGKSSDVARQQQQQVSDILARTHALYDLILTERKQVKLFISTLATDDNEEYSLKNHDLYNTGLENIAHVLNTILVDQMEDHAVHAPHPIFHDSSNPEDKHHILSVQVLDVAGAVAGHHDLSLIGNAWIQSLGNTEWWRVCEHNAAAIRKRSCLGGPVNCL